MINKELRPQNWNTAARIVVDAMVDMANSPEFALLPDSAACNEIVTNEFEDIVSSVFHSDVKADDEILQEQFFDIAVAGLVGYAFETKVSAKAAGRHVLNTVIGKQRMYGHGNIARFAIPGIAVRLNDKLERLKNLQKHDGPVLFEPINDTWLDICGYSVIACMWMQDWFMLKLTDSNEQSGT